MALKDLVTAAFGTSTATIDTNKSTLPASIDAHPQWVRHARQREELAATLAAAGANLNRLQRERVQVDRDVHEAEVQRLLSDDAARVTPEADAQRTLAADAAIVKAQARAAAIAEALTRLDEKGVHLSWTIGCEMKGRVEERARDIVAKLGKTLRAAQLLSDELAQLERIDLGGDFSFPVRHWEELSRRDEYAKANRWLAAAQNAAWDA